jgi:hypothetical protein
MDHVERVFLGRDRPALHAAVDWLMRDAAGQPHGMGDTLIVVPGGRAQRRLEELIATHADGVALVPPRIITLGGLADRLLPEQTRVVADRLTTLLTWASALREADPAVQASILPSPPDRDDWPGWWSLAEQVIQAADELGAHRLLISDVYERIEQPGDRERWTALSACFEAYESRLAERLTIDRHRARMDAIDANACASPHRVVLLGVADLQPVHTAMLAGLDTPIVAMIAADADDRAGFDALGAFDPAFWAERDLMIDDRAIVVCDRPMDQAGAVLDVIREWSRAEPTAADEITIGLGDATLAGPIERTLQLAELPVRTAAGRSTHQSRPVQLLRVLAAFAEGRRFDALATLLRHPDAEAYVAEHTGEPTRAWLTLLDRYATDHLAARPVGGWLGKDAASLEKLYRSACDLLPNQAEGLRPLSQWAEPIAEMVGKVYGGRTLQRYGQEDRPIVIALEQLSDTLQAVAEIHDAIQPHCTLAQAITLVVSRVAGQAIPEPGGAAAIELVGFLELLLDDAPRMAITGVNERHIPEPPRTGALISDGIRRSLGLTDDTHRLARDAYALNAILAWRDDSKLIVGKRSHDGDPLLPSRLLLQTDSDTLVRRIQRFTSEAGELAGPLLLTPGKHDRFLLPMPVPPDRPIEALSVTAFKDYLACPYRFYLKHVLKLEALDDRSVELSAGWFGTIAHDTFRVLAKDDMRTIADRDTIADRLGGALDRAFAKRFGGEPPVAALIQREQLRYRLQALAATQAALVEQGWQIKHDEKKYETVQRVDGEPFTITGKIDRIDEHPDGRRRVIDYKTSDAAKHPHQTHTRLIDGQRQWVDLQLPLYLDLVEYSDRATIEVGYLNVPKKVSDTVFVPAEWDASELTLAAEQRDAVIRSVRDGVFWPPKQPPVFDDGFGGLCGDAVADRAALISASAGGAR